MKDTYSEESWIDIEKRHTAEKLAYFTELSQRGISKRAGARIAGITIARLDYIIETMMLDWVSPSVGNRNSETFLRRKNMVKEGLRFDHIAKVEGITLDSLHSYCSRYGIKKRGQA